MKQREGTDKEKEMIARLLVIMKHGESDDVALGVLDSLSDLPEENVKELEKLAFKEIDVTASMEECVLYELLLARLPGLVEEAGKLMDGGKEVGVERVVGENPVVFAHFLRNQLEHPNKVMSWDEVEELIVREIEGRMFIKRKDAGEVLGG